jgi:hypothetical protein
VGILSRLFGREDAGDAQDDRQLAEMVERVAMMSPRLRLAPRCRPRLAAAIGSALEYLGGLVGSLGPAREASPAAWTSDPSIHAFFGSPDDVSLAFSRSTQLRALFKRKPDLQDAYAVLGMAMDERHTLGVAEVGGAALHDVRQTTVSFRDHQIRICAADEVELKEEIVRRMVDQLALEGLARTAADDTRRDELERERALLKTRLLILERQGTGMRSVVGGEAGRDAGGRARLRAEMDENDRGFASLGSRAKAPDRELQHVCDVFAQPVQLLNVSNRQLHLSRMNVVLDADVGEAGNRNLVEFGLARVPGDPPQERAFTLVRFSRAHMRAPANRLAEAERLL